MVTGIVGVFIGSLISRQLRDKVANADPLICAVGMLSSAPCLYIAMVLASISIPATYVSNLRSDQLFLLTSNIADGLTGRSFGRS